MYNQPVSQLRSRHNIKLHQFRENDKLKTNRKHFYAQRQLQESILKVNNQYRYVDGSLLKPNPVLNLHGYVDWLRVDKLVNLQLGINMNISLYHQMKQGANILADMWVNVNCQFSHSNIIIIADVSERLRNKKIQSGESIRKHIEMIRML